MSLARYACRYELCPVLHPVMPIALYEPCTVMLHVRVGHPLIRYSLARLSECNCVLCLVRLSPAESPGVANVAIRSGLWVRRRCKRVKSKKEKKEKIIQTVASRVSVLAGTLCVRGSQAAASYDESSLGHCLWASTAAFSSRGASAVPMAVSARR